MSKTTTKQHIE